MKLNIKQLELMRKKVYRMGMRDFAATCGISHQKYYDILAEINNPVTPVNFRTVTRIAAKLRIPENQIVILDE